jgi:uracil phosphoribosyltransferase
MVRNLSEEASILGQYMSEIRDRSIQKDPIRFRTNLERIAEILGYEVSKRMNYQEVPVQTPLGESTEYIMTDDPVLITILRAGLAMHNGLLRTFDRCDSAFVSLIENIRLQKNSISMLNIWQLQILTNVYGSFLTPCWHLEVLWSMYTKLY